MMEKKFWIPGLILTAIGVLGVTSFLVVGVGLILYAKIDSMGKR